MAKTFDLSKLDAKDIDKKFEKLTPAMARKIDNGGTRAKKKTTAKRKKKK